MAKDINIHLKTQGAAQTKQQLEEVGKASQRVGEQTAAGQKRGADETEKTTQKISGMSRVLSSLKTQVMGLVGAYLGLQGVRAVVTWLIQKLERIAQLQKDIYQSSLSLAEMGQALEMQTGTRGMQMHWAQQVAGLQAAGALRGPGVAQQMMVSMDIALAAQGGIKNQQVMALAAQLAPFIGAAGLGPEEVSKLFEFAGTAGVPPTAEGYKDFFAKLQVGYTASKATVFGQYLLGLQKGVTPFMAMGGGLEKGISTFVGARAVSPNEALAATLVEQMARLASGAYERPRKAMERKLGISWEAISMDERLNALLQYVGGIPEARRGEVLAAQGFPIELTSRIGMMVSPEARGAMAGARGQVGAAAPAMIDELTRIYTESLLGRERATEAGIGLKKIIAAPEFADWQTRIKTARAEHEILVGKGRDRWIYDSLEPYVMAFEQMMAEIREIPSEAISKEEQSRIIMLYKRLNQSVTGMSTWLPATFYPKGLAEAEGYQYTQELQGLQGRAPMEIHYHNDQNYYPRVGSDERGPRFTQD